MQIFTSASPYIPARPFHSLTYEQALAARHNVKRPVYGRSLDSELRIFCKVKFGEMREMEMPRIFASYRNRRLLLDYKLTDKQQLELLTYELLACDLHTQLCRRQLFIAQMTDPKCLFTWSREVYRLWRAEQWLKTLQRPDVHVAIDPSPFNWSLVCQWSEIIDQRLAKSLDGRLADEDGWLAMRSQLKEDIDKAVVADLKNDWQDVMQWLDEDRRCQADTARDEVTRQVVGNAIVEFEKGRVQFGLGPCGELQSFVAHFVETMPRPQTLRPFPLDAFNRYLRCHCLRHRITQPFDIDGVFPRPRVFQGPTAVKFYEAGYSNVLEQLGFRLHKKRIELMSNQLDGCYHLLDSCQWSVPFDSADLYRAVQLNTALSFELPPAFATAMKQCTYGFRSFVNREQFLFELSMVKSAQEFFQFIVSYWMAFSY